MRFVVYISYPKIRFRTSGIICELSDTFCDQTEEACEDTEDACSHPEDVCVPPNTTTVRGFVTKNIFQGSSIMETICIMCAYIIYMCACIIYIYILCVLELRYICVRI